MIAVLVMMFCLPLVAQIQLTGNNGEVLYVELTGLTDITRMQDPQGNWTDSYTYRRSSYDFQMSIRPHIVIKGGHCVPNGYQDGQFSIHTKLVTGFVYNAPLSRYIPVATDATDKLDMHQASGSTGFSGEIDVTRNYQSKHSLSIEVFLTMIDYNCDTLSNVSFQFWLYPEYTFRELEFTRLANLSNADQVFDVQASCNACNRKGVPGFTVSSSSLLPFFSDQDYAYSSLGPDVDFTRTFSLPGTTGMFGDGWRLQYEQGLQTLKGLARFTGGSGETEIYRPTGDTVEPIAFSAEGAVRKRLNYYPSLSRFELFDPETKLVSVLKQYAASGDTMMYRLDLIRDLHGNTLKVSYDAGGRIDSVTDAAGQSSSFLYNASGLCSKLVLPDGRSCSYAYDSQGRLVQVTDLYGNDVGFAHDAAGFITRMRVNQDTAVFTYDVQSGSLERLASSRNLDGNTTTYAVELAGSGFQINRITDPTGVSTLYEFNNQSGATTSVKDAATGAKTSMVYNTNRMLTDLTLPQGGTSNTTYDSLKRISSRTDFRGMITNFTYDSLDNLTTLKDAVGNTWHWSYDAQGSLLNETTPMGRTRTFTYYSDGSLKTSRYGNQPAKAFTYDAQGNLLSLSWPNSGVSSYEYSAGGLLCTSYTDPRGNKSRFAYDNLDRMTVLTNPDQTQISTQYNCCAPVSVTYENGSTIYYERDPLLRITRITDAGNNSWNYSLDGAGKRIKEVRPDNSAWYYGFDPSGKPSSQTDPFGEEITFGYDLNGMLISVTDQSGNASSFGRSANGNIISRTIGNSTVTYTRDSLDRITSILNARGQTASYAYNADGLVESLTAPGIQDAWTYDGIGRPSVTAFTGGSITYEYTAMNSPSRMDYGGGRSFRYEYDLCNNLSKVIYSDNSEANIRRDNRGRTLSMSLGSDSAWFEYDAATHLKTLGRSNGLRTYFLRDANSRVTGMGLIRQNDTLMKRTYARNSMGFVIRETRKGIGSNDSVFLRADTGGYYRQGNQLSSWQGNSYAYDADGNLVQVQPGMFTAVYDALNRLSEWTQESGSVKANFAYNALGLVSSRHFQKGSVVLDMNYFYDAGNKLIAMEQQGGGLSWKFYYNGNTLVAGKRNSDLFFYHFDPLGNTIALSDRNGNIVQRYSYDAWGKILVDSGSVDQPFKYSGAWGVIHEYANLYRMPYRFYDAWTGKFLQRDPSGFSGGFNLYRYAMNNPMNFIDPSGLQTDEDLAYEAEYEAKRDEDPNYNAYEHLKEIEAIGSLCNFFAYFIPGAQAGQAKAEDKPDYEVGIEAGKELNWGLNLPFYYADMMNRIYKAAQKDSPTLRRQYGDPDRPPVGGGRKSVNY
jgi:RHS repeat-associated protein